MAGGEEGEGRGGCGGLRERHVLGYGKLVLADRFRRIGEVGKKGYI